MSFGCSTPPPPPQWKVSVVRPDGVIYKTYTVLSYKTPFVDNEWGGQMQLYYVPSYYNRNKYIMSNVCAPVGWMLEIERK